MGFFAHRYNLGRPEGVPPPPVFWEKRLQAVENKGQELQNKGKEAARD
jgi:hypothetical protein